MHYLSQIIDNILGYDYFISYAHADGKNYPNQLTKELSKLGFKVFIDTQIYKPGDDLNISTKRRVRMSRNLVVITKQHAMQSEWVAKEIKVAKEKKIPIILIDINNSYSSTEIATEFKNTTKSYLRLEELKSDEPSNNTIFSLQKAFKGVRQERLITRFAIFLILFFGIIAGWASLKTIEANNKTNEVSNLNDSLIVQNKKTEEQRFLAEKQENIASIRGDSLALLLDEAEKLIKAELYARMLADSNATIANQERSIALNQEKIAKRERIKALNQKTIANQEKEKALESKNLANAERISTISQLEQYKKNWNDALLLAYEAYSLVEENPSSTVSNTLGTAYYGALATPSIHYSSILNAGRITGVSLSDKMELTTSNHEGYLASWSLSGDLLDSFQFGQINSAIKSPNSNFIAIASPYNEAPLKLWNVQKKEYRTLISEIANHTTGSVLFPTNELLITALNNDSLSNTIQVFNLLSSETYSFRGKEYYDDSIYFIDYSIKNRVVIVGTFYGNIEIWNLEGALLKKFRAHDSAIINIIFSKKDSLFYTCSAEGTAKVWNLEGKLIKTIYHNQEIYTIDENPKSNNDLIVTASDDNTAKISSIKGNSEVILNHNTRLFSAYFSNDGNYVITSSEDNAAKIWSLDGELESVLYGYSPDIRQAFYSNDDNWVITSSETNSYIKVWRKPNIPIDTIILFNTNQFVKWYQRPEEISFINDDNTILTKNISEELSIWEKNGKVIHKFQGMNDKETIFNTKRGDYIQTIYHRKNLITLSTINGDPIYQKKVDWAHKANDGYNVFYYFETTSPQKPFILDKEEYEKVPIVCPLNNGKMFYSQQDTSLGFLDLCGSIKIWDRECELNKTYKNLSEGKFFYSPKKDLIITIDNETKNTPLLWNSNGKLIDSLERIGGYENINIRHLIFSPNEIIYIAVKDDYIYSWGFDGSLKDSLTTPYGSRFLKPILTSKRVLFPFITDEGMLTVVNEEGTTLLTFTPDEVIVDIDISPNEDYLAVGYVNKIITYPTPFKVYKWMKEGKMDVVPLSPRKRESYGLHKLY